MKGREGKGESVCVCKREKKKDTYRIIVATAISTILNNTFLQ